MRFSPQVSAPRTQARGRHTSMDLYVSAYLAVGDFSVPLLQNSSGRPMSEIDVVLGTACMPCTCVCMYPCTAVALGSKFSRPRLRHEDAACDHGTHTACQPAPPQHGFKHGNMIVNTQPLGYLPCTPLVIFTNRLYRMQPAGNPRGNYSSLLSRNQGGRHGGHRGTMTFIHFSNLPVSTSIQSKSRRTTGKSPHIGERALSFVRTTASPL